MRVLSSLAAAIVLMLPVAAQADQCTTFTAYRTAALAGFPASPVPASLEGYDCEYREGDGITCTLLQPAAPKEIAGIIAATAKAIAACFPGTNVEDIDGDASVLTEGAQFYLSSIDDEVTLDVYTAGEDGEMDDEGEGEEGAD